MTRVVATLESIVRAALREAGALAAGEICLVAVSGGRDSMVLLDLCAAIGETEGAFVAGTVDHGLRAFEAELGIIQRACSGRQVPWRAEALPAGLRERARSEGRSLEDQARRERYAALDRLADGLGATRILTAHTVEDQAETVLLRMLRGAGPTGLAGILPRRGPRVLRPLLGGGRAGVAAWADAHTIPWVRDPGNTDHAVRRTQVRWVLRALETAGAGGAAVMARNADVAADHGAGLRDWALEHFRLGADAGVPLVLAVERVGRGAVARVRLHALLGALGLGARIERSHVEALADLAAGAEGRHADLPGGLRASRRGDRLHLGPGTRTDSPGDLISILGPGTYETPIGVLEVTEAGAGDPLTDPRVEVVFDRGAVDYPLRLRTHRLGERVAVHGLHGHRRLVSDLLSEARVPRHRRSEPWILEGSDAQVLWVVGCRRGDVGAVDADTETVLRIRLQEGSA